MERLGSSPDIRDRNVAVGKAGIRCYAYAGQRGDNAAVIGWMPEPIAGLSLEVIGQRERPIYRESTGIYGFIRLKASKPGRDYVVRIADPKKRFLARRILLPVPDLTDYRKALRAGEIEGWDVPGDASSPQSPALSELLHTAVHTCSV